MPIAPLPATYDLDLNQLTATLWLPSGTGRGLPLLPKLLPPRFTAAEQLAEPDQPRTRLVKDVLRTGRWKVGVNADGSPRWWIVTAETLRQIEQTFDAARAAGNEFNLCWGHGNPETRVVDSRDTIAPLDQVFLAGETLWAAVYVDAHTAADLRKAARKVSVRVVERWMDGAGNSYAMALLHVAVVDLPVMTGQGPFLDLANSTSTRKTVMDFQTQRQLWDRALTALGLSLPDTVTEDTLPAVVEALLTSLDAPEEQESEPATGDTETLPALTPAAGANFPADLGHLLTGIAEQVKDLSHRFDLLRADGARTEFTSRLEALAKAGRINARTVTSLTETGANHNWDLSLLVPFEDIQMVDLSRRGKTLATGRPPAVTEIEPELTSEDIDEGVAWLIGKKK